MVCDFYIKIMALDSEKQKIKQNNKQTQEVKEQMSLDDRIKLKGLIDLVIKLFDNLTIKDIDKIENIIINRLVKTSLTLDILSKSIFIFAHTCNIKNISFKKITKLIGKLNDHGFGTSIYALTSKILLIIDIK